VGRRGASGARARTKRATVPPPSDKPAVFVLPGILGSNLKVGNDRVWLSPRIVFGLKKLAYSPGKDKVVPDAPLGPLRRALEVPREDARGRRIRLRLAKAARRKRRSASRTQSTTPSRRASASGLPVRIVAHSMGGLLARTMLLERPQTWERMMARAGARVLMLGTPNGGSWAPMQVLSGDDNFGNLLVAVGAPFAVTTRAC
jgi:pimeloyl-ACP methyl ester carboxylesterase